MPAVTAAITTYNRGRVVVDAIESVLAQRFRDFELIVVDDGSRDGTAARVEPYIARGVRYIRQNNGGISAARNHAVRLARSPLIALLDDDDIWTPDKLERSVDFANRHPEVGIIFTDVEKYDGAVCVPSFTRAASVFGQRLGPRPPGGELVLSPREAYLLLLQEIPMLPSTFMIRRQTLERCGAFDETWRTFEDWEFLLRVARTEHFGYIDRPLTVVRISPDSKHRVEGVRGRSATIRLMLGERRRAPHDSEARAAIRRGIAAQRKHLGWYYVDSGRPLAAFQNYVRGFCEVLDPDLLVRALAAWVPRRVRGRAAGLRAAG